MCSMPSDLRSDSPSSDSSDSLRQMDHDKAATIERGNSPRRDPPLPGSTDALSVPFVAATAPVADMRSLRPQMKDRWPGHLAEENSIACLSNHSRLRRSDSIETRVQSHGFAKCSDSLRSGLSLSRCDSVTTDLQDSTAGECCRNSSRAAGNR